MMSRSSRRVGLSVVLCLSGLFLASGPANLRADQPTTAPATQPSTDAIIQLLQSHQYAAAIQMINKAAYQHDSAGSGIDPYLLDILKADAFIGLKSINAAVTSLQAAVKATFDPHELAVAKSTILLLKNSNTVTYIPKTAPAGGVKPGPIPLADRDRRAAALAALLNDLLVTMQPRIETASKSPAIPPIYPVLADLRDLKDLDEVVNGNADETTKISAGLIDHGHNLIVAALKGMWARLDEINNIASQPTANSQITQNNYAIGNSTTVNNVQKAGLSDDNKTELKNMMDTCDKIHQAADAFVALAASDKDKLWAAVNSDASRVNNRANDLLNFVFNSPDSYYTNNVGYGGYGVYGGGAVLTQPIVVPGYNPVLSITPGQTVTPGPGLLPVQGVNPTVKHPPTTRSSN